jgi:hypothetical protein
MRCIAAWSRSNTEGAELVALRSATQRFFDGLPFFTFAGFDAFFAARFALETDLAGFAGRAGFATLAALATGAGAGAGIGATAAFAGIGASGFTGGRALEVFNGGSGCLRGLPLLRAACPSAMSLSKAAFASASRRACCELRSDCARSFSARKRSSGLVGFIR